jgi:hypothetical protein
MNLRKNIQSPHDAGSYEYTSREQLKSSTVRSVVMPSGGDAKISQRPTKIVCAIHNVYKKFDLTKF